MKKLLILISIFTIIISCSNADLEYVPEEDLVKYVNPFIGTTYEGNQNPGSHYPFGMVFPSPVNKKKIGVTNYEINEPNMYGFAMTTMVGTGCAIYGSALLMPQTGELNFANRTTKYFDEKAEPGYYFTHLNNNVKVELTSTIRAGMMKLTYPPGENHLLLDLSRINTQDTAFMLKKLYNDEIAGYRTDGEFAGKPGVHKMYFVLKFEKAEKAGLIKNNEIIQSENLHVKNDSIGAYFTFHTDTIDTAYVKFGVSYVSIENARENMELELGEKVFDEVVEENKAAWNELLGRINVEGGSDDDKTRFYTAIYHTMSHPHILEDNNGEYPKMETLETMKVEGRHRYTLYSLWDTYRTLHPFFSLAYPEIQSDMVLTMLDIYDEGGYLPHWELNSVEKGVMNGDPAVIVINDSYQRGIKDFDTTKALKAMLHNASEYYVMDEADRQDVQYIRKALDPYLEYGGYIPHDYKEDGNDIWGIVATTLEYNIADWNLAQYAKSMGDNANYEKFMKLSEGWKFFYDEETGFIRSRYADGTWLEPFDPFNEWYEMKWKWSGGPGFTEGYAWHYNYFVPHDIPGLMEKMGGSGTFINRLQTIFDSSYYRSTNEPDIAFPFLFNYVKGEEWRTQKTVRTLIDSEYKNDFDGIPGNDDTGTMSAWLLFAMMGIYPDCPGDVNYQICSPYFDKITIQLNQEYYPGKEFVIETLNNSKDNFYINSIELNGEKYEEFKIEHNDIVKGGKLSISLGSK